MRTLLTLTLPVETSNAAVKDGRLARVLQTTIETLKPEAAYFAPIGGKRAAMLFFDLRDPSDIPVICEPLFAELDASVQITPVMNAEDLRAGLDRAAKKR